MVRWHGRLITTVLIAFAILRAGMQPAPAATANAEPARTAVTANGLVADLYKPTDARGRLPAMIVLGGSEGGLNQGAGWEAWLLAAHGFVALQVSYFDAPGQSRRLAAIPLEYLKTAIDWLQNQPDVDPKRIGIMGTSIGGEAVLLIASHYPEIKAVVAAAPSSVVWPGVDPSITQPPSTFTLAGEPLPDLPYGGGRFTSVFDLYAEGLTALGKHPDAVIRVEQINGPVMLVCGEADRLWPSCPMARQAEARLTAKGFKYPVQVLAYPDAGHFAFGPPLPADAAALISTRSLTILGGTAAGNAAARQDSWPRAIDFLDAALKWPDGGSTAGGTK